MNKNDDTLNHNQLHSIGKTALQHLYNLREGIAGMATAVAALAKMARGDADMVTVIDIVLGEQIRKAHAQLAEIVAMLPAKETPPQ